MNRITSSGCTNLKIGVGWMFTVVVALALFVFTWVTFLGERDYIVESDEVVSNAYATVIEGQLIQKSAVG